MISKPSHAKGLSEYARMKPKFEKKEKWQEMTRDGDGKMMMRLVIDKGRELSTKKRDKHTKRPVDIDVFDTEDNDPVKRLSLEEKVMTNTEVARKKIVDIERHVRQEENPLMSLKKKKLVMVGRKLFEKSGEDGDGREEVAKKEDIERKRRFEDRIRRFQEEKKTPAKKKIQPVRSQKTTPARGARSMKKNGDRSSSSPAGKIKKKGDLSLEKVMASLRLGQAQSSKKFGNTARKIFLENCKVGTIIEGASPLCKINSMKQFNPLNPLKNRARATDVRGEVIGGHQEMPARPGNSDQSGDPAQGHRVGDE